MQDIGKIVAEKYDLEIKNIFPFRDSFIINTVKGKKIVKKNPLSPERISFIHGAKEHLYKNNFKNLDRYLCTTEGAPCFIAEDTCYTVSDVIEGTECNFENEADIIRASNLLASLHKASRGYIPLENSIPRNELGKLPGYFYKRLEDIKKLKKAAKKGRSKFDYLFLDYVDYFYNLGENTLGMLVSSKYDQMVKTAESEGIFCHHDFTQYNIVSCSEKLFLTNFEYCCFELKVYDIVNFIRRKMRKCNWDINEARIIVDEYKKTETLGEDDLLIMKILLQFPQKFWRVANRYYNSRRSWSERIFISKLQEVIDEIEGHRSFLDSFDILY
ncbi:MAG: CotS family spore coat protein [Bacillota bacterium]|nr:CotS family spore coat protein [Bacillota bacterium]